MKNPHQDAREIQVIDRVRERVVLEYRLSNHGTTKVELCTRERRGEVSIADIFSGKRKHHGGVLDGTWFDAS